MTQSTSSPIRPSPYQQAVIDFVAHGTGSAIVKAVAGAGKTKTIELSLPMIPESKYVSILAFNKIIADELKDRIAGLAKQHDRPFARFRASTFHSMGGGAVAKRLGKPMKMLRIDDKKCRDLCERVMPVPSDMGNDFSQLSEYGMYAEFITKLVGFAKGVGVGPLCPDVPASWWDLIRHHDLTLESEDATEDRAIELAQQLLALSNKEAQTGWIDYDDMLYLPLLWKLRIFQADWVIVDEAQDTSPVRRALAKLNLRPGGRSLWVGDPKQAIYGFTGASADAMDLIKHEFRTVELPLTVCYRCAKDVVAQAQSIVPYIEASDTAPQGTVEHLTHDDTLRLLDAHDAILCRNTAPLVSTAMRLIAGGRACKVLGKDIGVGLVNLIRKMRAKGVSQLQTKLVVYRDREVAKFMGRGEEGKAERVTDTVECLLVIAQNLDEQSRTIPAMVSRIEAMFSDTNGCLILSTVHKAKGREWPRVAILEPELMPSKWARSDWQYEQELNIKYVAFTRAQQHLIFMDGLPKKEATK
jgi:DNA helicase-2/ATP-dependent DNA helicase PcrA